MLRLVVNPQHSCLLPFLPSFSIFIFSANFRSFCLGYPVWILISESPTTSYLHGRAVSPPQFGSLSMFRPGNLQLFPFGQPSIKFIIYFYYGKSEMCFWTLPRLSLQTKSFAKKENMEGGQEAPTQTQNKSEHQEVTNSSGQPNSISIPTSDKRQS